MILNLILCISNYVNLNEYEALSLLNSEVRKKLILKIPFYIKLEFIINELKKDLIPCKLISLINPLNLYKVPKLSNKIYCGNTQYIDFINKSYFKKKSIIRGYDILNRPFISFHYNNKITTIFQRYCDDNTRWVTGGENPLSNSVSTSIFDFDDLYFKMSDTLLILMGLLNNGFYIHENIKYKLN